MVITMSNIRYAKEYFIDKPEKYYIHKIWNGSWCVIYSSSNVAHSSSVYKSEFPWENDNQSWGIKEITKDEAFLEMI